MASGGHNLEDVTQFGFKICNLSQTKYFFDPMNKYVRLYLRYPETEWKTLIFQIPDYDDSFKFTKDNFRLYQMGVTFRNNHPHFKLFRDEFEKLFECGIIQNYMNNDKKKMFVLYHDPKSPLKIVEEKIEKKVLTLEDLKSGFVIWLVTVLIATIVFIWEKSIF